MMSARELEQAKPVQSERRMSIMNEVHDMITAKEKQATQSGICFSCGINEQTSDEIGQ